MALVSNTLYGEVCTLKYSLTPPLSVPDLHPHLLPCPSYMPSIWPLLIPSPMTPTALGLGSADSGATSASPWLGWVSTRSKDWTQWGTSPLSPLLYFSCPEFRAAPRMSWPWPFLCCFRVFTEKTHRKGRENPQGSTSQSQGQDPWWTGMPGRMYCPLLPFPNPHSGFHPLPISAGSSATPAPPAFPIPVSLSLT